MPFIEEAESRNKVDVLPITVLIDTYNIIWRSGAVPLNWQTGVVVPISEKPPWEGVCQGTGKDSFRRNNTFFILVVER